MPESKLQKQSVVDYFSSKESRWGYSAILGGIKHFGYYPENTTGISMKEAQYLMMDKLHDALNLPSGSRILDAGCGEGKTALYLAEKYQYSIVGVDLLDSSIQKANRNKDRLGIEKVDFRATNYINLDFKNGTFDGVYTLESLVHATDYLETLREFHRVLKHNGKLVLIEYSIPQQQAMTPQEQNVSKLIIEGSAMHSLQNFTHGESPKILKNVGFSNIAVEDISPQVMPMVEKFYQLARIPYWFIRVMGLRRKFVNTTAGFEIYKNLQTNKDFWRWNVITATKQ